MLIFQILLEVFVFAACTRSVSATGVHRLFDHVVTQTPAQEQKVAVLGLISRFVPDERSEEFQVEIDAALLVDGKDQFQLKTRTDGRLVIRGSTGVAAALGFNYYLKNYCNSHVEWKDRRINIPTPLPAIRSQINIVVNDRFHYNSNVCTHGYSYVWYDWEKWQREIDWWALNGVNLPLAFTGQEIVLQNVFAQLGISQKDLDAWFSGPAFLPWFRMGNIVKWAGPLSQNYLGNQVKLQQAVLVRMRAFGMTPVLPAFSGHVPDAFVKLYPNASVSQLSNWSHFNSTYTGTYYLNPTDSMYQHIGALFLQEQTTLYGTDHLYNIDPWNEMLPENGTSEYLSGASRSILTSLQSTDPDAVWVLQAWMFHFDPEFWNTTTAKAFLTAVDKGSMLILDLAAEYIPTYSKFDSFYGQPFIWCMLHNYGGRMGIYGHMDSVNEGAYLARKYTNSTMVGIGLTMEGTGTNYILYELMNEMRYRKPVDLNLWLSEYTTRRYGFKDDGLAYSWQLIRKTALNCSSLGFSLITSRPSWGYRAKLMPLYDTRSMIKSTDVFMLSLVNKPFNMLRNSSMLLEDLVDRWRETLFVLISEDFIQLKYFYNHKNIAQFKSISNSFLDKFADLEAILATHKHYILGKWVNSAENLLGNNSEEMDWLRFNALNQITMWGPAGEINDYAAKQWSGLVSQYYRKRWQLFLDMNLDSLTSGLSFNNTAYQEAVLTKIEQPFSTTMYNFATKPFGDTLLTAFYLSDKYNLNNVKLSRRAVRHIQPEFYSKWELENGKLK